MPSHKELAGAWQQTVVCEGVICLPAQDAEHLTQQARVQCAKEKETTLEEWQRKHHAKIAAKLAGTAFDIRNMA